MQLWCHMASSKNQTSFSACLCRQIQYRNYMFTTWEEMFFSFFLFLFPGSNDRRCTISLCKFNGRCNSTPWLCDTCFRRVLIFSGGYRAKPYARRHKCCQAQRVVPDFPESIRLGVLSCRTTTWYSCLCSRFRERWDVYEREKATGSSGWRPRRRKDAPGDRGTKLNVDVRDEWFLFRRKLLPIPCRIHLAPVALLCSVEPSTASVAQTLIQFRLSVPLAHGL